MNLPVCEQTGSRALVLGEVNSSLLREQGRQSKGESKETGLACMEEPSSTDHASDTGKTTCLHTAVLHSSFVAATVNVRICACAVAQRPFHPGS
jgi:hypothetical protein